MTVDVKLNLPDHTSELREAEDYIKKLRDRYAKHVTQRTSHPIDKKEYITLYDDIVRGLYFMGHISQPAFNVQDTLEKEYFTKYKHAPELAKKLYWDHYESVHRPYTLLKNRLFRLIEELGVFYTKVNQCPPPDNY